MTQRFTAISTVSLALLAIAAPARAQPCLDEARRRAQRTEVEEARAALRECEAAQGFERSDLVRYYETLAMIANGEGDAEGLEAAVVRLLALSPGHEPGPDVPPAVRRRFVELAGRSEAPALDLSVQMVEGGGVEVVSEVSGVLSDLVRRVRLFASADGGAWEEGLGPSLRLSADVHTAVDYHGVAEGVGGAPVTLVGTRAEPLHWTCAGCESEPTAGGGISAWVWIGGGVLLAGLIALTVFLVASPSGNTNVSAPTPDGFTLGG